nr:unnamed protein product [Callosobruchus chinensis]
MRAYLKRCSMLIDLNLGRQNPTHDYDAMVYTETQMTSIRGELEIVQKALKLQTKRCRQLVAEYTRRLQEKEVQYQSEKSLRDDQLAKVLRALLIFEARLKQEQKFISHQLNEKDYIIKKQSNDIKKLLSNQYCKNCNQYYTSSPVQESLGSSSEYVVTDYQSSNFESLDSSSENYALMSEKDYNKSECSYQSYNDDISKSETESVKSIYQKNRNKDSLGRRSRKIPHRKSIGTYFEVLKLRNDTNSPMSNEDNTSNDYEHLDSLPPESITDKISEISGNIESIFEKNQQLANGTESSTNISTSECNNTVINKCFDDQSPDTTSLDNHVCSEPKERKLSDTIPVFDADEETNDNWYASASDQEDEEHRDVYRNNPVLECMNQILLQNINDPLNSPPKTPNIERKSVKNKRVKFSDEEQDAKPDNSDLREDNLNRREEGFNQDYYETPVQKPPNFYETPQSIYSNDYEQILSKRSETFSDSPPKSVPEPRKVETPPNHYYIDMESRSDEGDNKIMRKSKISRIPPALPPKPANLTSKYKINSPPIKTPSEKSDESVLEFEPDYCSISELNLPQQKNISFQKISVVAEINAPTSLDVLNKLNPPGDAKPELETKTTKPEYKDTKGETSKTSPMIENSRTSGLTNEKLEILNKNENKVDILSKLSAHNDKSEFVNKMLPLNDTKLLALSKIKFPNEKNIDILSKLNNNKENKIKEKIADFNQMNDSLIVKKCVEKLNIQLAKQTPIKSEVNLNVSKKNEPEIPKLPQVSEIIIPDENEEKKEEQRITQDNYVKNNSQIFKLTRTEVPRRPIVIGSSVSSLISEFNNQQILSELKKKPDRRASQHMFSSFDKIQNSDKQAALKDNTLNSSKFESFDLSQNFEEFKLDDCDIEEYKVDEDLRSESSEKSIEKPTDVVTSTPSRIDIVRTSNGSLTPHLNRNSIEMLKKQLEHQKGQIHSEQPKESNGFKGTEPTYEHFLECTGLSSKSILTPSRLLSNHKSMLKPKDVKLRSKVRASNGIIFDRHANASVKYWSEPYV